MEHELDSERALAPPDAARLIAGPAGVAAAETFSLVSLPCCRGPRNVALRLMLIKQGHTECEYLNKMTSQR